MKTKNTICWLLAVVITIAAAIYQHYTGPTNPAHYSCTIKNVEYKFSFNRSFVTNKPAELKLPIADTAVHAYLFVRTYPGTDSFAVVNFVREADILKAQLPGLPPAGKLEFYVKIDADQTTFTPTTICRFRGDVPALVLIPHVLLMFLVMLFSSVTALQIFFKIESYTKYMYLTIISLFVGGLVFGPMVQKYAFGEYWTGFPYGFDLTDNKTLIVFLFWMVAVWFNHKGVRKSLIIMAAAHTIIIFSIPHSMWGSQLDPKSGKIETGKHASK